jgi:glycosyltransferase involved in cell wall biosynthesis
VAVGADVQRRGVSVPESALRLSICIPTYKRAGYLNDVLTDLFEQGVDLGPFEVIVGDNASPDDTPTVLGDWAAQRPEVRYVRQTENVGVYGNLLTVYRLARGRYAVYLADDDRLNLAEVRAYMDCLDANPNLAAAYSAWEYWDEQKGSAFGASHHLDEPLVFNRTNGVELFNALINRNILPEICMFRTDALRAILSKPSLSYWSYVWLANLFDVGDVVFLPRPYYRSIVVHRIDGPPDHVGAHEVIYARDNYQAGLEYLAQRMFRNVGCDGVPPDQAAAVAEMIGGFMASRLPPAIQLLLGRKNPIGAYEFLARRLARGINNDSLYAYYDEFYGEPFRERLPRMCAIQSIVETLRSITLLDAIVLYRLPGAAAWMAGLASHDADIRSYTLDDVAEIDAVESGRALMVTGTDADREALVASGVAPGLVLKVDELLRQYAL